MTFLDICSGIGGFRLGMEQAGHKCVGFIEKDKFAVKSYRAIHNTEGEYYHDDIFTAEAEELPEADCWCFGFPCQSFSINGKRLGFGTKSGNIIFRIFELAKTRKPKILFAENVEGLLSHDRGRTFGTILSAMGELGYIPQWQVINSNNYVAQNRERVYIIGHLRGERRPEVFPIIYSNKEDNGICSNTITAGYKSSKAGGTYITSVVKEKEDLRSGQGERYKETLPNVNGAEWGGELHRKSSYQTSNS
jgi:DNA (cytosine-5)-methyltransferase 1